MINPIGRDNPFFIVTPPLLWGIYFGLIYAVNGIACAKGIGGSLVGGMPMVNVILLGSTTVTLVFAGRVGTAGLGALQAGQGCGRTPAQR
jgi:hypothetical protein